MFLSVIFYVSSLTFELLLPFRLMTNKIIKQGQNLNTRIIILIFW